MVRLIAILAIYIFTLGVNPAFGQTLGQAHEDNEAAHHAKTHGGTSSTHNDAGADELTLELMGSACGAGAPIESDGSGGAQCGTDTGDISLNYIVATTDGGGATNALTGEKVLATEVILRDTDSNCQSATPVTGALCFATDTNAMYRYNGSSWDIVNLTAVSSHTTADTAVATVTDIVTIEHTLSSGTAAIGMGVGLQVKMEHDGDATEEQASIDWVYTDPINTQEDVDIAFNLKKAGTVGEVVRFEGATGHVGIGTVNPGEIAGASDMALTVKAGVSQSAYLELITDNSAPNTEVGQIVFSEDAASLGGIKMKRDAGNGGEISFWTKLHGSTVFERMTIIDSGGVGIGTATPDGALHVMVDDSSQVPIAGADDFVLEGAGPTGISLLSVNNESIQIVMGTPTDSGIGGQIFWDSSADIFYAGTQIAGGQLVFRTAASTERARIDASGLFMVGTSVTTGGTAGDVILANGGRVLFVNNAGSSSSNYGMYSDSSDDLNLGVPTAADLIQFEFAAFSVLTVQDLAAGGCIMFEDTDAAGFTQCTALNGTLSCVTDDGDGVCD